MKDKYKKLKKQIKMNLGLGTTIGLIGVYAIFSKMILFGILFAFVGALILGIAFLLKKETINLEEVCKEKCYCCNKDVKHSIENRYYVNDNLVKKSVYDETLSNKKRMEIHYYKCEDCNFCLTVIHTYLYYNNKEKQINDKVSMDFDYTGDY